MPKRQAVTEENEIAEKFQELMQMGLKLSRDGHALSTDERNWIQTCITVFERCCRQPAGRMAETGEVLTVCRSCYTYSPESSHQRHTGDCLLNQLLCKYYQDGI